MFWVRALAEQQVLEDEARGKSLKVVCLSGFELYREGCLVSRSVWKNRKSLLLFLYLVMHRDRPLSQDHLLKLFWPGKAAREARHNLSVAVYNIRHILEPELEKGRKSSYISNRCHVCQFHSPPHFWYDVDVFTRAWEKGSALIRQGEYSRAWEVFTVVEQLYKTGYLSEIQNIGWIEEERRRLREIYIEMVLWLCSEAYRRQDYNAAVWYAQKVLAQDGCREEAHQLLMRTYLRLGKRTAAIRQYEICSDLLKKSYGLAPLRETQDLYRRILQGEEEEDERPWPGP